MRTIIEIFEELLAVPSPPGREGRMADKVMELVEPFGFAPERDGSHNITVDIEGSDATAGRMVLAAHMDELAMVVTGIGEDGRLRVTRSGGLFPAKLGEGPVDVLGNKQTIRGIFSFGSMHRKDAADLTMTWDNSWITTGMSPDGLAEAGVSVGTAAVPSREMRGPITLGDTDDPMTAAWTFDDRMGVALLLHLLEEVAADGIRPRRPLTVAFTVHEEGGCHGAKNVARKVSPEVFIAIDGCPTPEGSGLLLDGRPGVWCKDGLTMFDQGIIIGLESAAQRAGVGIQRAVFDAAASDASAVYAAGFADRVATFGHVRENSHGYEVARTSVFNNAYTVLREFFTGWEG